MIYLNPTAPGDGIQGPTMLSHLGATPAQIEAAVTLLKKLAAKLAEYPTRIVYVAAGDDFWLDGNNLKISGEVFVAVNNALALAQRVPLAQDGQGRLGTGGQVVVKLQEGITALMPLADTARAGAAPPSGLSTGAKVALGVGVVGVLGLFAYAIKR